MSLTILYIAIIVALIIVLAIGFSSYNPNPVEGKKMECGDMTWGDTSHDDNKASSKEFKQSLKGNGTNLCELSKKVDHMEAKGVVKDWDDFKQTHVYKSATDEQKHCLWKAYDLGNSLADYEILYCGIDND